MFAIPRLHEDSQMNMIRLIRAFTVYLSNSPFNMSHIGQIVNIFDCKIETIFLPISLNICF